MRLVNTPLCAALLGAALLAGCGGMKLPDLNPFGSGAREVDRTPENATEYRCANDARFYVRRLDKDAVWLILPDRQVRLEKSGTGYASGRLTLQIEGNAAKVQDPPLTYSDCRVSAPGKEKS
jgi:hypothetical protein